MTKKSKVTVNKAILTNPPQPAETTWTFGKPYDYQTSIVAYAVSTPPESWPQTTLYGVAQPGCPPTPVDDHGLPGIGSEQGRKMLEQFYPTAQPSPLTILNEKLDQIAKLKQQADELRWQMEEERKEKINQALFKEQTKFHSLCQEFALAICDMADSLTTNKLVIKRNKEKDGTVFEQLKDKIAEAAAIFFK